MPCPPNPAGSPWACSARSVISTCSSARPPWGWWGSSQTSAALSGRTPWLWRSSLPCSAGPPPAGNDGPHEAPTVAWPETESLTVANRFVVDITPLRESSRFRRLYFGHSLSYLGRELTVVAVP